MDRADLDCACGELGEAGKAIFPPVVARLAHDLDQASLGCRDRRPATGGIPSGAIRRHPALIGWSQRCLPGLGISLSGTRALAPCPTHAARVPPWSSPPRQLALAIAPVLLEPTAK